MSAPPSDPVSGSSAIASPVGPVYVTSGAFPLTREQLIGTLIGLLLSLLLAALDQTIVGTAMPRIISQLNGFERYPWVTTAYLLASTIAVPIFARLSDLYGRKGFFLWGAVLFVVSSGLCGAAGEWEIFGLDGMNQLILFRGLQGIGAGMITGLLFTIIGDIFAPRERGKYQGLFAAVWGLASIFGPTLGGWLTDSLSWRWTFYVNLPVGAIAVAMIALEFPNIHPPRKEHVIDWMGVFTLSGSLIPLLLALTWVADYGWTSPRVVWLLAVAVVMAVAFIFVESRAVEPLLPLSLFKNRVIAVCSLAVFLLGMGMFGVILYLPLFMQGVLGISATKSGSLLTPLMIAAVATSIFAGQYTSRTGRYKLPAVGGSILVAIAMILFARMDGNTTEFEVIVNMVIAGLGMGVMQPIYTLAVQNSAPRAVMGAATASTQFFRSIGSTLGVAIFGSMLLTLYKNDFNAAVPKGVPALALKPFANPLMLVQIKPRLVAAFGQYPGGKELLDQLMGNVRVALIHGLQVIFLAGAVAMALGIVVNLMLPEVPLRTMEGEAPAPAME